MDIAKEMQKLCERRVFTRAQMKKGLGLTGEEYRGIFVEESPEAARISEIQVLAMGFGMSRDVLEQLEMGNVQAHKELIEYM